MINVLLTLSLLFIIVGCIPSNDNDQTNIQEDINDYANKEIPEFEFSDTAYNMNFSGEEENNYYFKAGKYLYKLDTEQNLTILSNLKINNEYFIWHVTYYKNHLYLIVSGIAQNQEPSCGVAKMNTDETGFQYSFDAPICYNVFIQNDIIYFNFPTSEDRGLWRYSLKEPFDRLDDRHYFMYEERTKFIKETFPNYPYEIIRHIHKNHLISGTVDEDKNYTIIQYTPQDNTEKRVTINSLIQNVRYMDLIDNRWFIHTDQNLYICDEDFSNYQILLSGDELATYSITPDNGRIYTLGNYKLIKKALFNITFYHTK